MAPRGGRGGGRGGRGPLPRDVQASKKISWLLRHGAEKEGLTLGAGGFLSVQDVLSNRNIRSLKVTFDELRAIVQDNDKQRFTMIHKDSLDAAESTSNTDGNVQQPSVPSDKPQDYLIRANQGHSLKVEDEGLLTPITAENVPSVAVHVESGGLKAISRNHVHFATGLPEGFTSIVENGAETTVEAPVISGMRKSSTVLVFLDVSKAMDAGIKLWMSDNGVVLSEGNAESLIPLEVLRLVEDRTGEGVLLQDGKIVKGAPSSWAAKGKGRGKG
ncbi:tRNA 2'-phosphotransferase [Elasticomyces elasticus]|uniref:2'-phosphotransferase n=1 Tax=Elasticomyces elasticus TaxID=574655 RepID=A0AAN8A324_9PEZI|nr:tRNA 2'-phosphotransferase [Elasticomyces elasticus]